MWTKSSRGNSNQNMICSCESSPAAVEIPIKIYPGKSNPAIEHSIKNDLSMRSKSSGRNSNRKLIWQCESSPAAQFLSKHDVSMWITSSGKNSYQKMICPCESSTVVGNPQKMICQSESSPAVETPINPGALNNNIRNRSNFIRAEISCASGARNIFMQAPPWRTIKTHKISACHRHCKTLFLIDQQTVKAEFFK